MTAEFCKRQLNSEEQKAYDCLLNGFRQYESKIRISAKVHQEEVLAAFTALEHDHPVLFFVCNTFICCTDSLGWVIYVEVSYLYELDQILAMLQQLSQIAESIMYKTAHQEQRRTAELLHDYLVNHAVYQLPESGTEAQKAEAYSLIGALINKRCVCSGFAKAYQYLCEKAHIPCLFVAGTATDRFGVRHPHAWNMISIEGKWYHVDTTFDLMEGIQYNSKAYFLLSDREILFNHSYEDGYTYPSCPESLSKLAIARDLEELIRYLIAARKIRAGFSEYRLEQPVHRTVFTDELSDRIAQHRELSRHIQFFFTDHAEMIQKISFVWKNID